MSKRAGPPRWMQSTGVESCGDVMPGVSVTLVDVRVGVAFGSAFGLLLGWAFGPVF
ncbi:MAG: hypothetical protein REI11_21805 [Patulibacter sp.]|nr:hypothetical protein [Patulibacter sp.]